MDAFIQQYVALVNGVKLTTMFGLIALDFVLGVILSIFNKTFAWSKLASFMDSDILKLALGYLVVGVFAVVEPSFSASVWATWAIIDAKLVADCINKLKALGAAVKGKP